MLAGGGRRSPAARLTCRNSPGRVAARLAPGVLGNRVRIRSLLAGLLSLVALLCGCTTPASGQLEAGARDAPVVLRSISTSVDLSAPLRSGYTPGLASELFWLSVTSLMTFGVPLADVPNVLDRHRTTVADLTPGCRADWTEAMKRWSPAAVDETRESVLHDLQSAITKELARLGRDLRVEVADQSTGDADIDGLVRRLAGQLGTSQLLLADISYGVALRPSDCVFVMRALATLHVEITDRPATPDPARHVTLSTQAIVPVKSWASDPAIEQKTRRDLLEHLGNEVVATLSRSGPR